MDVFIAKNLPCRPALVNVFFRMNETFSGFFLRRTQRRKGFQFAEFFSKKQNDRE